MTSKKASSEEIDEKSKYIGIYELNGRTSLASIFSVFKRYTSESSDFHFSENLAIFGNTTEIGIKVQREVTHIVTDVMMTVTKHVKPNFANLAEASDVSSAMIPSRS